MTKKVFLTALLLIATFGFGLVLLNSVVFQVAFERVRTLPPITSAAPIPRDQFMLPPYFEIPQLTVIGPDRLSPESFIPYEDAAILGAQYIWDLIGEPLDGKIIVMEEMNSWEDDRLTLSFFIRPRNLWIGNVFSTQEDVEKGQALYHFTLDAETGERQSFLNPSIPQLTILIPEHARFWQEFLALEPNIRFPNYEKYMEQAIQFVMVHFNQSDVMNAYFIDAVPQVSELQEFEGFFKLVFRVLDDTGQAATITISSREGKLVSIRSVFLG